MRAGASRRQDVCLHPGLRRDSFLGAETAEHVCPDCGATGVAEELAAAAALSWRRLSAPRPGRRRLLGLVAMGALLGCLLGAAGAIAYGTVAEGWYRYMVVETLGDLRDAVARGCELVDNPEVGGRRVGYVRCPTGPARAALEDARAAVSGFMVLAERGVPPPR